MIKIRLLFGVFFNELFFGRQIPSGSLSESVWPSYNLAHQAHPRLSFSMFVRLRCLLPESTKASSLAKHYAKGHIFSHAGSLIMPLACCRVSIAGAETVKIKTSSLQKFKQALIKMNFITLFTF